MSNEKRLNFPYSDRRANFLRQELYNHDRYLRNPQTGSDPAMQVKFSIDAEDYQNELEEIVYMRSFIDKATQPTGIQNWQALILVFYTTVGLIIAALSLWLNLGR